MSKENYDLKKLGIDAISNDQIMVPAIPVSIALQEAEDLFEWCKSDKEALIKAGIVWELVEDLPVRIGACRYTQSVWQKEYKSIEDAQKEWGLKSPVAFGIRDELLHHFFHGYRKYPDLLNKVQKIAEGNGSADMIQDLSDLAVLGTANPDPLKNINMDMSLLSTAAVTSEEMADLLAKSNGARFADNKMKTTRDKAYTYVKMVVDELRRIGQYVFWRNEDRKKGYVSRYLHNQNARSKKGAKTTTAI